MIMGRSGLSNRTAPAPISPGSGDPEGGEESVRNSVAPVAQGSQNARPRRPNLSLVTFPVRGGRDENTTSGRRDSPLPLHPEVVMHRRRPERVWLAAVLLTAAAVTPAVADVKGRACGCYVNLPSYGITSTTHCDSGWLDRLSGGA